MVYNPLILEDGGYKMDMELFKEQIRGVNCSFYATAQSGRKSMEPEELEEIAEICYINKALVVSDEIHADLTLPGIPIPLSPPYRNKRNEHAHPDGCQ